MFGRFKNTHSQRPTPRTSQHSATTPVMAWMLSLLRFLAASQLNTFVAPLASCVDHTMAGDRGVDDICRKQTTLAVVVAALT